MEIQPGESADVVSLPGSMSSEAKASIRPLWSRIIGHLCCGNLEFLSREKLQDLILSPETDLLDYVVLGLLYLAHIIVIPFTFTWELILGKGIMSWEQIFVISCVAMSLDPFFFYIPIINEENKCILVDIKLRNTLLVLRLLTDCAILLHIVSQIRDRIINYNPDSHTDTESYFDDPRLPRLRPRPRTYMVLDLFKSKVVQAVHKRAPWLSVSLVIDVLTLLPIPQVTIAVVFLRMGDSKFVHKRTILNVFLILQYLPRICQIYLSSKKLRRIGLWAKGAFNFFLYILSGHVLASFWYLFSIQRETSCWHQTCKNVVGCLSSYECSDSTPNNIALLNDLCPVNAPNTTVFDFGMYLEILQSGNTGSVTFSRKFFYSLWWGIRNLSNFGTNLQTSSDVWENCFAVLIGLFGLLLFLYLIGNVQTCILVATTKSVKIEDDIAEAEKLRQTRIDMKYLEIKMWMSTVGLTDDRKRRVRDTVKYFNIAERNVDSSVDVEFLHRELLPYSYFLATGMINELRVQALKKVFGLVLPSETTIDDDTFYWFRDRLKPIVYTENSYIVREGERCDLVVFILRGVIEEIGESNGFSNARTRLIDRLENGDYYGKELLHWASENCRSGRYEDCSHTRRTSMTDVKCRTKVEALIMDAHSAFLIIAQPETIELKEEMGKIQVKEHMERSREEFADTSTSIIIENRLEQVIQLQNEQHVMTRHIREDMASLGRRYDSMAAFLAILGYQGSIPPPPGYPGGIPPPEYRGGIPTYVGGVPPSPRYPGNIPPLSGYLGGTPSLLGYQGGTLPLSGYPSTRPPPPRYPGGIPPPSGYQGTPPPLEYPAGVPLSLQYRSSTLPPLGHLGGIPPHLEYRAGTPPSLGYRGGTLSPLGYRGGILPPPGY